MYVPPRLVQLVDGDSKTLGMPVVQALFSRDNLNASILHREISIWEVCHNKLFIKLHGIGACTVQERLR